MQPNPVAMPTGTQQLYLKEHLQSFPHIWNFSIAQYT